MIYVVIGILALVALVSVVLNVLLGTRKKNAQPVEQVTPEPGATEADLPYTKKLLLTKNEWAFYKKLKPICDRHNLHILAKVRLADLVDVSSQKQGKDRIKYFNMVSKSMLILCCASRIICRYLRF